MHRLSIIYKQKNMWVDFDVRGQQDFFIRGSVIMDYKLRNTELFTSQDVN